MQKDESRKSIICDKLNEKLMSNDGKKTSICDKMMENPVPNENTDEDEFPFNNMTMGEFADFFPENALNFVEDPTFWPHNPEEQLTENDIAPKPH